jgi:outer membrane protein TolC
MRPRVFLVLIVSVALLFIKGQARADVFQVQVLSLEECVEIALSGHPDLAAARSDLEASRARVGQARTQDNPSLAYSTSYTERGSSLQGSSGGLWSSSLTLSQLVTDWGKTHSSVKRSLSEQEISSLSLKQALLDVEYDVRRAYFLLLKAEKNLEVAKETMSINELQLEKAEAFFEAGRISRYDVTAAQVSRSNANMARSRPGPLGTTPCRIFEKPWVLQGPSSVCQIRKACPR